MTDVEQLLTEHLRRRADAAVPHYDLEAVEQAADDDMVVALIDVDDRRARRTVRPAFVVAVAAAAAALIAIAAVTIPSDKPKVSTPSDRSTVPSTVPAAGDSAAFDAAIAESGIMTTPSARDVAQAMDADLYKVDGGDVSATGNHVSLLSCRAGAASTCGTGVAYVTRAADGDVHGGLLGETGPTGLDVLDERYFVASNGSKAWLVDAVTGKAGPLSVRSTPTTMDSPEQLLAIWGDTPQVVDARDSTIRPLTLPDDVAPGNIDQHGIGRIWARTAPDGAGRGLGLASSDDGGATWSKVALPEQLDSKHDSGISNSDRADLRIAADGDRIAVTGGLQKGGVVYVSDDGGRNWTTATHPDVGEGNRVDLGVLADGRLVLTWYIDASLQALLASTGSDWAVLEKVDSHPAFVHGPLLRVDFGVNRAGVAVLPSYTQCSTVCAGGEGGEELDTIAFSTDLKHWSTIETSGLRNLGSMTLAEGDVKLGAAGGQTLQVTAKKYAGGVVGVFRVNNVKGTLECADTNTIDGEIRLGGTVTDDTDGQGLAVTDGKVAVGDRVALIIRKWSAGHEGVAFYADPSAGSCTKLVDAIPYNLDGGFFSSVATGDSIKTVGGYFKP
jgi:hypothetical protein